MKAKKAEMRAEALERMKILNLDDSIIENFKTTKRVMVTDQQFWGYDPDSSGIYELKHTFPNLVSVNGRTYQIFTATPKEERLEFIKEVEKKYGVMVYHVIRVERDHDEENDCDATYIYLTVCGDSDDWESERYVIPKFSTVYGYVTIYGYPKTINYLEYGEIPIKPFMGDVVAINVI